MEKSQYIDIPNDAAIIIVGGNLSICFESRKNLQNLGLNNIHDFSRGSQVLEHLNLHEPEIIFIVGHPIDMASAILVRAIRSRPLSSTTPVTIIFPSDTVLTADEKSFYKSYQIDIQIGPVTDRKIFARALKETFEIKAKILSLPSRVKQAKSLLKIGLLREAENIYAEVLDESDQNILAQIGLIESNPKNSELTLQKLEALIKQDPKNYFFKFELMDCCIARDDMEKAFEILEDLMAELAKNSEVFWLNELGVLCISHKFFDYCLKIANRQRSLVNHLQSWLPDMLLSRMYFAAGADKDTLRHLKLAEKESTDKHAEIENLKAVIARKKGDYPLALEGYLAALMLAPDDHRIMYNIGICYEYVGKPNDAIIYLNKAISLSPNFTRAQEHLEKIKKAK